MKIIWRILATFTALLLAFLILFFYGAIGYGSGIEWAYEIIVLGYSITVIIGLIFWHLSTKNYPVASLFRISAWIIFLLPLLLLISWTVWVSGLDDAFVSTLKHMALALIPAFFVLLAYLVFYRSIRFAWVNIFFLGSIAVLQIIITLRNRATIGDAFSSFSFDDMIVGILISVVAMVIALLNYFAIRQVAIYQKTELSSYRYVLFWRGMAFFSLLTAGLSTFIITERAIQEIRQDASRMWGEILMEHIRSGNIVTLKEELKKRRLGISIVSEVLVSAVKYNQREVVILLAREGADIEGETIINYQTALTSAAAEANVQMIHTLLKLGADLDHGGKIYDSKEGRYVWMTPLSAAVISLKSESVVALINAGAVPDMRSGDGVTPLMYAAKLGDLRSVNILLKVGAKIDLQDPLLGWSALHYAAAYGQDDTYQALLSAGASFGLCDSRGRTAEDLLRYGKDAL